VIDALISPDTLYAFRFITALSIYRAANRKIYGFSISRIILLRIQQ
jgi:hypothetical protein